MRPGLLVIALATLFMAVAADAQQPQNPAPSLVERARSAGQDFRAVDQQQITLSKVELNREIQRLDAFLRTGAPYKAAGWKRYLQWDDLVNVARSDGTLPVEPSSTILSKLRANLTGLELPHFTRLRDALARHAAARNAVANEKLRDEHAKQVEQLVASLDTYEKDAANGDAALAVGRSLAWLENNGQAPDLVSAIRARYGRPNFFGHASQRFAAAGIERDVDQLNAVHDNILGTSIHGTARMVGHTTLSLVENPKAANMNILLGGTAWSNSVGYNGPVTIYSTGVTSVSGRKSIFMTAEGMSSYASQAACGTRSSINGISAKHRIIENIAWKRAGQQKGAAEAEASLHASWRVAGQMDREAGRMITEQNQRYLEKIRHPLVRRGEFPEELTFSTTRDRIQVRSRQDSAGMLAAPDDPPGFSQDHDLAARAHESAVTNYAQGILGAYELTDLRLEQLIKDDLKAELSEELRVTRPDGTLDPDKEPWSIIFAKELPARAKFDDGGVWIAIRADGFTRGEGETPGKYRPAITELVEISAQYRVDKTPEGATMRRDGDVRIRFPNRANPDQITLRDNAIVTFIRRKFRSLFKEEFVGEGLVFKGQWERAGRLKLQEIAADNAWLRLGWDMPSPTATATTQETVNTLAAVE